MQASNLTAAMAVVAPSIGLGALQFSKELAAKYGRKSRLTMAAVPLTASADRQSHAFPLYTNFQKCTSIKTLATISTQFFTALKIIDKRILLSNSQSHHHSRTFVVYNQNVQKKGYL